MAGATQEIKVNKTSKGLAVIITNDYAPDPNAAKDEAISTSGVATPPLEQLSTNKDGTRLEQAFKTLNFDVCWKHNAKTSSIQQIWGEIKKMKYETVKHYRCIIFVFSGHGEIGGKLIMQDGCKVDICQHFIAPVLPGQARSIGKIPKVFIIDACRGEKRTEIVQVPKQSATNKGAALLDPKEPVRKGCHEILFSLPEEGNFLVAYSTLPGCIANDFRGDGSLWLKLLAEEIPVSNKSIDDVLTGVNRKLHDFYREKKCEFQQPEKVSRLNDVLYLNGDNNHSYADSSRHLMPSIVPRPMEPYQPSSTSPHQQLTSQRASEGGISLTLSQPIQSTPMHSGSNMATERVPKAKYKKGTGKYCVHLKQFTNPKFDYVTDRSSGSTRHRCKISYYKDGRTKYEESGYCTSILRAEEAAVKKILSHENWPPCGLQ